MENEINKQSSKFDEEIRKLIFEEKIKGLSDNHTEIQKDFLFAAIRGLQHNGENYIEHAIKNGAKFILKYGEQNLIYKNNEITFIEHQNPRKYLSFICSLFFKNIPNNISTVTGTNGKTSIVNFANQIFWKCGIKSASIGTLGVIKENIINQESSLTTMDSVNLHKSLSQLKMENIDNVFTESSSIGIDQNRVNNINFKSAVISNITSDHIDYHKTQEHYINSKLKLFRELVPNNYIIHVSAIKYFSEKDLKNKKYFIYAYGAIPQEIINQHPNANIATIEYLENNPNKIKLSIDDKVFYTSTKIYGNFQTENLLAAILMCYFHQIPINTIFQNINLISPIKGRFDFIKNINGGDIFIDYAHNPEGLNNILQSLSLFNKKIITIFGCGGNRDSEKRPEMARIAERYSEHVIITDDNPRFENADSIRYDILKGFSKNFNNLYEIPDRETAIRLGISMLDENKILLIAGKGAENYQIKENTKYKYSDYDSVNNFNKKNSQDNFNYINENIKTNFELSKISRINIGGEIEKLFVPTSFEEMLLVLSKTQPDDKIIIFGACSNVLISPFSINALGIKLSKLNKIYISKISESDCIISESGAFNDNLAKFAKSHNIKGFEFLNGIPGSIGGGIFMNAGCFGSEFSKILSKIEIFDINTKKIIEITDFSNFEYRNSNIPNNWIILRGFFKIQKSSLEKIEEKEKEILAQKWNNQPKLLTCGSTFKNPTNHSAWRLIKDSMPENFKIGEIEISNLHANFIINHGNGNFKDFINMISLIKKNVILKFGICLELEIKIIY